jgi:hypothetical protein
LLFPSHDEISVIIHDLDVLGTPLGPSEANAVLVIDPNGVLPGSIALQFLQSQTGKRKGVQGDSCAQLIESLSGPIVQVRGKGLPGSFGILSVEDVFGTPVLEGDDQASDILLCKGVLTLHVKHNTPE